MRKKAGRNNLNEEIRTEIEKPSINKVKNQSIPTSVTVRTKIEKQSINKVNQSMNTHSLINKINQSLNTHQRDCPHRDAGGDEAAAQYGQTRAERVPEDTAHAHPVHVLTCRCSKG
jgi:hypothetical protein